MTFRIERFLLQIERSESGATRQIVLKVPEGTYKGFHWKIPVLVDQFPQISQWEMIPEFRTGEFRSETKKVTVG